MKEKAFLLTALSVRGEELVAVSVCVRVDESRVAVVD